MTIDHSEFHSSQPASILLNRVVNFTATNSLLNRTAVDVLDKADNATSVRWRCTLAPAQAPEEAFTEEEMKQCEVEALGRSGSGGGSAGLGGGSAAALALAAVSAGLLLLAVAVLAWLHRQGRLEQYL